MDTYEKKYNEALKRARKIHSEIVNNEIIGFPDQIETIFPELAESEDERIRKAIRLILIATEDEQKDFYSTHGLTRKDCTDWLEKQEQKPISSCDIVPYIDDKIAALQDMWREEKVSFDWDDMKDMIEDVARHFYHKEQKPAEKQDYSGLTDLERAIHRGFLVAGVENVPVTIIKETAQDCLAQMKPANFPAGFYVTLPDGKKYYTKEMRCNNMKVKVVTPQPPAWSEEDESMRWNIISLIGHSNCVQADDMIAWLKSLRPQPQGTYKQVIHTIYGMLKDKDFYEIQPSHRVSLLNDIRVKCKDAIECAPILDEPSWKPSEEQMEALQRAIDACESEWAYQDDELRSLLNDLKKL